MSKERLEQLEQMLAARTDHKGRPASGYATNVAMIKDEMRKLRAEMETEDDGA